MRRWLIAVIAAAGLAWMAAVAAETVFQPLEFDSPEQQERYTTLINELRCLVCQNQSIAESNADLALDLRRKVREMLRDGADDDQIVEFMVARYGDFVLYRPPMTARTLLLWIGPFVLGLAGLGFLFYQIRRRRRAGTTVSALSDDERRRLDRVLEPAGDEEVT